jgi:hypothetical protein
MVELKYDGLMPVDEIATLLANLIGPRQYWLHNKIGGEKWEIRMGYPRTIVLEDDAMATFITLKLT